MSKWYGNIGYNMGDVEVEPGIWTSDPVEKPYFGDLTRDFRKRQDSGGVNDNINIANVISIVADPFAFQNCSKIVYAEVMGTRWKVNDVEVQFPRLILSLGGVYNGQ